jgi:multidrug transporter EmrE-like cation transporter
VALLLIPVGMVGFRERVSLANVVGILFCIAGLVLVTRR